VFQHFNLVPHLVMLENCVLAPIWVRMIRRTKAEEIATHYLDRVKILEQANQGSSPAVSSNQVAIARSLCMNPNIYDVR
jgi:general L-amino acid transport system ATP-binding protein